MNRLLLTPVWFEMESLQYRITHRSPLSIPPKINDFFWRIEQVHVREGGFALIQGDPGTGKSVALRALAERLERQTDLTVGILNHPPEQPRGISTANWPRSSASCSNPCNRWGRIQDPAGALDQSPRSHPDPLLSAH
nr:hypothetical protein [Ferrovum myxofaciens]